MHVITRSRVKREIGLWNYQGLKEACSKPPVDKIQKLEKLRMNDGDEKDGSEEGRVPLDKGSSALLRLAMASPVSNNEPRTSKHFNRHGKPKWHLFSL